MHHLLGVRAVVQAVAVALAVLLVGVSIPAEASTPPPAPEPVSGRQVERVGEHGLVPGVERIAGANRYVQAVLAAQAGFVHADTVYLANGEGFADALSAAAVAGVRGAPLLLTPAAALPEVVAAQLQRLSPTLIVVVGGTLGVSDRVMDEVALAVRGSTVVRVGGADRYAVSRALIADPAVGVPRAARVFLATGASFPDALAASPAAARVHAPVLLVNGSAAAPTAEELRFLADAGAGSLTVLGGTAAVGAGFESVLGARWPVRRIGGADRFEVGAAVNRETFPAASTVYLASGTTFADALSGATLAARDGAPLYTVAPGCVPAPVVAELTRLRPARVVLLGGTATLSPALDSLTPC